MNTPKYQQLSLFPTHAPTRVPDRGASPKKHRPSRKAIAPQPVTRVIEPACTTQCAAHLLGISTSTLYRARKEGRAYRKAQWTAIAIRLWRREAIAGNTWRVTHTR